MNLLALDTSSIITGWAVFEDQKLTAYGTFKTDKDQGIGKRLVELKRNILSLIVKYNINKVAFEDIQLQQNVQIFKVLAMVFGLVEQLCTELDMPHQAVHSQTWKSTLQIKGRDRKTQKQNAKKFVKEKFGVDVPQDAADAICIGYSTFYSAKYAW